MAEVRFLRLGEGPADELENGRGVTIPQVDAAMTGGKLDLHVNVLRPGGAAGSYHYHSKSDNVYIILEGQGELVVEGTTHTVVKDDVVYIPAGTKHSLSNRSDEVFKLIEIYTPAGDDFDFLPA